ncbi:N-acetylglucosaminyl-diphospho-decaprenol L-rhamnosyltransferase [Abditibacteriota bacterium]|nr:N-acetylglucosaminyl-diphospho-decaprenol L-rhamnosyltransferase [Abditibacteriota bacterium]
MLSVLIVSWNTRDLLRACLASLQTHLCEVEHEIIVVDCASADESAAMVPHEFPTVKLIASNENLGFALGNNLAFAQSRGEWVWLLNPDTEVFENAAQTLLAFLEAHPHAGGVASALIDARDGHFQRSCRTFPTPAALWCEASGIARLFPRSRRFGFYKMGYFSHRKRRQVEQPMASSFLLRRAAVESIGEIFDERFPIFFNDVDLCWRLVLNGWEIWYEPAAKVLHWGGASTKQRRAEMMAESHASLEVFYRKWFRSQLSPLLYAATIALVRFTGWARVTKARLNSAK